MKYFIITLLFMFGVGAIFYPAQNARSMDVAESIKDSKPDGYPTLVLGGGCFWCLESEFRALNGVVYTRSGYAGGDLDDPGYRDVTTGKTGHAEAVEVTYDPKIITEKDLLTFFLTKAHDPTQLNHQGVDVGPQYRSVIFYADDAQKAKAEALIKQIEKDKIWKNPIVTTLEPRVHFWEAEEYHQQYYEKYEKANGRKHIRVLLKHKK